MKWWPIKRQIAAGVIGILVTIAYWLSKRWLWHEH